MTIQEITALRKSGRLTEALAAAQEVFALNANVYTAGALFWCLYDLLKQKSGDDAPDIFHRIEDLYKAYGTGDQFQQKAIQSLKARFAPDPKNVIYALNCAKNGDAQAYKPIEALYMANELDKNSYSDFAWLIYYTLKSTPVNQVDIRKRLLARYLSLNVERPSKIHSLILSEAVKVEQNTPLQFRIRDFVNLWGLENLRVEDWKQFTTDDGNVLPSLVEKLIGVYVKELMTDKVAPSVAFVELMEKAIDLFANNQNMPYFMAKMLIAQGKHEEATRYYKNLILRFPAKFYLWRQLAELVDDTDIKLGLLCKAVNTGTSDEFIGAPRLRLASLLIDKGLLSNARAELEKYRDTYQKNGWHLKQDFIDLARQIPAETPTADNQTFYSQYSPIAEEYIYSELPSAYCVKVSDRMMEDRNRPGRRFVQWTLKSDGKAFYLKKPQKHGLDKNSPNGSLFEIKVKDDKIVWIQPAVDLPNLGWFRKATGRVALRKDKRGNPFTIIDHVYVGDRLLKGVTDGSTISVMACRQDDGRWSAVSLLEGSLT